MGRRQSGHELRERPGSRTAARAKRRRPLFNRAGSLSWLRSGMFQRLLVRIGRLGQPDVDVPITACEMRSRPQEWCLIRYPRDLDSGLYAVMAVMVTSCSVAFWVVILVSRLFARMSRPR